MNDVEMNPSIGPQTQNRTETFSRYVTTRAISSPEPKVELDCDLMPSIEPIESCVADGYPDARALFANSF